jgi:uncharacterized protein YqgC (DUF456 family)
MPILMGMLDISLSILTLLIALVAVLLNIVSLPGNWLVLVAGIGMCWLHNGSRPHWIFLLFILFVLLIAELIEFLSGMVGARKFGASKKAAWAAIVGAMLGGLIGIPPITAPTLGMDHLFAAILGAFIFAWLAEIIGEKPMKEALLAALGAALGRTTGLISKIVAGLVAWMILFLAWLIPFFM